MPCELTISKSMSATITLLCLVHGESSQHTFSIDITKISLLDTSSNTFIRNVISGFSISKQSNSHSGLFPSPSMMMHYSKALCSMTRITVTRSYHLAGISAKSFRRSQLMSTFTSSWSRLNLPVSVNAPL